MEKISDTKLRANSVGDMLPVFLKTAAHFLINLLISCLLNKCKFRDNCKKSGVRFHFERGNKFDIKN